MKKTIYILLIAIAALTAGCKETQVEMQSGLQLKISADDTSVDKIVKSGSSVDLNSFLVTIEKKDGKFSNTWAYGELPTLVELSTGDYTVNVTSPGVETTGWEVPVYGGSMDFAILDGVVTPIDVVCTLQNMKNSVYCSQHLVDELTTFDVKIANNDGFVVWEADEVGIYEEVDGVKTIKKEPSKYAYFSVEALTINVSGYRELDNTTATLAYEIKNVQARDHHILYVDAYVTGQSQMTLSIDSSVNDNSVDIKFPGIDSKGLN